MSRYPAGIIWLNHFGGSAQKVPCPICGKHILCNANTNRNIPGGWQISHIISDARGGTSTLVNLVPLCLKCNRSMGSDNYYTFLAKKGIISSEQSEFYNEEQKKQNNNFKSVCEIDGCGNKKYLVFGTLCNKHLSNGVTTMEIDIGKSDSQDYIPINEIQVSNYDYWTRNVINYYPFKRIELPANIKIY
jgi:hypothetical protein